MIGILLIYFIGRYYYYLAEDHQKSRWGFAILGVITYYVGSFIAGFVIGVLVELFGSYSVDEISDFVWNLIALPFGLLACYGLFQLLKRNWEKKQNQEGGIIDEIGQGGEMS